MEKKETLASLLGKMKSVNNLLGDLKVATGKLKVEADKLKAATDKLPKAPVKGTLH